MSKKMLIAYYTMDGNTKQIAERLQKVLGADIMVIDTAVPYTGTDDEIVKQGEEEVKSGFLPELKPMPFNVQDYDVILIGSPTWWYTMASPVNSFIAANNWAGKTVVPFQTHCGWPGKGLEDMKAACKDASFAHEMDIQFNTKQFGLLVTPDEAIDKWIREIQNSFA